MKDTPEIIVKQTQLRKGVLAYAVLLSIESKQSYAYNILENLKDANIIVVEGTLYPLLNRFKREELLEYEWKESKSGPPRKYYNLTKKGSETLDALHITWKDLLGTINFLTNISGRK